MGHHGPTAETIDRGQIFIKKGSIWSRLPLIGAVMAVVGLVAAIAIYSGNKSSLHAAEGAYEQAWHNVQGAAGADAKATFEHHLAHEKAMHEALDQKLKASADARAVWETAVKSKGTDSESAEIAFVESSAAVVTARDELAHAMHEAKHGRMELAEAVGGEAGEAYIAAQKQLHLAEASTNQFWFSYLTAFMTFLALGLGGLFFVIIQHLVRAGWSIVVRRIAENMMLSLPFLALLSLPIVFLPEAQHALFHWTHPEAVISDVMLASKEGYLNLGFFQTRMVLYILAWSGLAYFFYSQSTGQDKATGEAITNASVRMRWWAPIALVMFAISLTFCAFDLLMSLDPHWFSTMFGVYYFAGCALTTHAFIALIVILLHRSNYLRGVVTRQHYHDLGKYMFGFTVFWTYIGFSQYFLIWYSNIPEETGWFLYRQQDDFIYVCYLLVIGRFLVPFFYMMNGQTKRFAKTMLPAAIWIVCFQVVDMFFLVQPVMAHNYAHETGSHHMELVIGMVDYLTVLGVGGVFLAVFGWGLNRSALVPTKDPRLTESLQFVNIG